MLSKLTRIVSSKVPESFQEQTLIVYLSTRYQYHSTDQWLKLISKDMLKINGQTGSEDSVLNKNDTVEYLYEGTEPDVDWNYSIIYEDSDILIINKSGNLPVHPAGKFFNNTLWADLSKKYENIHFINRIDRETSGAVLVALNRESASSLGKQIQNKQIEKNYIAVVEGKFPAEEIVKKGQLIKGNSNVRKKLTYLEKEGTDKSNSVHSVFKSLEYRNRLTMINCRIITGKTHQIRATLNSMGYPLVGDKLYGVDEEIYLRFINKTMTEDDWSKLRIPRQALHASTIKFRHPANNTAMTFEAPLPIEIKKLMEAGK